MATIDIKGLDKAELLAALYNNSKPLGMGFLQANANPMGKAEAQAILDRGETHFDYLNGRVMKIDLSSDTLETWGYDRDVGQGAAAKAVEQVRSGGAPAPANDRTAEFREGLEALLGGRAPSPQVTTFKPKGWSFKP